MNRWTQVGKFNEIKIKKWIKQAQTKKIIKTYNKKNKISRPQAMISSY